METLRGLVESMWECDSSLFTGLKEKVSHRLSDTWSKPDPRSGSSELRRITTAHARNPLHPERLGVRVDFFELHWADLTSDSTWSDFLQWMGGLLLRNPKAPELPDRILPLWRALWAFILVVIGIWSLALLPGLLWWLRVENHRGTWIESLLDWQIWRWLAILLIPVVVFLKAFLTSYFGDVARYVSAAPRNIRVRQDARERGLKLISELTRSRKYSRIIIVGHSLGSILAHDLVSLAWADVAKKVSFTRNSSLGRSVARCEKIARRLLLLAGYTPGHHNANVSAPNQGSDPKSKARLRLRKAIAAYRSAQRQLFRKLSRPMPAAPAGTQEGPSWLISDLVTVGSPLTHADFLLARNRLEFLRLSRSREVLRCPPILEENEAKELRFSFEDPLQPNLTSLHHAAALAPVRWTNIHDAAEANTFLKGDIISGPLRPLFGPGLLDLRVCIQREAPLLGILKVPRLFTHTLYWRSGLASAVPPPDHIQALRDALNLLDDWEAERRLRHRAAQECF